MISEINIPEPVLFNPLKHHLGFIREFISSRSEDNSRDNPGSLLLELKHLGTSVMDVYTGNMSVFHICTEIIQFLYESGPTGKKEFAGWAGRDKNEFRVIHLSDGAQWTIKYNDNLQRWVHVFPSRGSLHSFRVKSNTMKSALLYYILIGKDYITGSDLNRVRPLLGLSPVKSANDTDAITGMIEILRGLE